MSTKTTFKRVALVTVAAMGFGLLSVVPSTATTQMDTLTLGSATTASAGSALTNTITQAFLGANGDTMSVSMTLTSAPATNSAMPQMTTTGTTVGTNGVSTDGLTGVLTDTGTTANYTTASAKYNVAFTPTVPGTYVVTFTAYNASGTVTIATPIGTRSTTQPATAAPVTWTITVAAFSTPDSTSTSFINSYGLAATGSTAATVRVAAGSSTAGAATITATPYNTTAGTATTGSATLVATVSGPGTLLVNQTAANTAASTGLKAAAGTGATGVTYVHLFADGTTGTSTVTITWGTYTATHTVIFSGPAATITTTTTAPVIDSGSGATSTAILTATVKDAAGNVVPGYTVYAVSASSSVFSSTSATTGSAGTAVLSVRGQTAGTSVVTVQNVASGSTATLSAAAVSIRAGTIVGQSVVMSLDKATYAQGEAAVLTVTVNDAAGLAVADSSNTYASAVTSTRAMSSGSLPSGVHVTTGSNLGVLTYKINVPNTSGAFTISATAGSGWTGTTSVTATVSPSAAETAAAAAIAAAADIASAAVDAAAEATDAANAATDAANAAAEAADAATAAAQDAADAIASLATAVAELMADLKAQISAQKAAITALTNLVIKIQKKVKA